MQAQGEAADMRHQGDQRQAAQWHALITTAELHASCTLGEQLEQHLVRLLLRQGTEAAGEPAPADDPRAMGDGCLLLLGLHPEQVMLRHGGLARVAALGRSAYEQAAAQGDPLASALAEAFDALVGVLNALRRLAGGALPDPLTAFELWAQTGSLCAWEALAVHAGRSLPVAAGTTVH